MKIFTPAEDATILAGLAAGVSASELGRLVGVSHQSVLSHAASLEFGRGARRPTVELSCLRCRAPFGSVDRRTNRLCEGCVDYAADAARGCLL